MLKVGKILQDLKSKVKRFLPLFIVLFLTACSDSCETYQEFLNSGLSTILENDPIYGNCFFCPLFKILTDGGAQAATDSWNKLHEVLQPIVGLVMAIYVAILVLKNVGTFTKQNFADILTDNKKGVLILGFKTAVIILLLSGTFFIESIIVPLIVSSGEVGLKMAAAGSNEFDFSSVFAGITSVSGSEPWKQAFDLVYNVAKGFNDASYKLIAVGNSFQCHATEDAATFFSWQWQMLVYGSIYTIFGWIAAVGVCFYLVNMVLNFTIAAVLLPLGIAFAVSDKTMSYTKNIWGIFLNTFCNFIMMGIVIGLSLKLIDMCMGMSSVGAVENITSQKVDIVDLLNNNQIEELAKNLWDNGCLFLTIVILSIVVKLVSQISGLAKDIAETSGVTSAGAKAMAPIQKAIGKKAGKMFVGAGKSIGVGLKTTAKNVPTVLNHWYTATGAKNKVNKGASYVGNKAMNFSKLAYRKSKLDKVVNYTQQLYNTSGAKKVVDGSINFINTGVNFISGLGDRISDAVYSGEKEANKIISILRGDNNSSNNGGNP